MRNPQRRRETRKNILEASAQLFAERGYDATGVAEICTRAGISKGAFYYHFATKQAVFVTLINEWLRELEESLTGGRMADQTVDEWLLSMARSFEGILTTQTQKTALALEFWTQARRDDAIRQAVVTPFSSFQTFFHDIIAEGIVQGDLRPIDPIAGAQVLLSLASGLFFQGLLDPQGADWSAVAEVSISILLEGLRRKP